MSIENHSEHNGPKLERISFSNVEELQEQISIEWKGGAVIRNSVLFYTTPHSSRVETLQAVLSDSFEINIIERTSDEGLQVYDIEVTKK